jgi:protein N-terminal amidase
LVRTVVDCIQGYNFSSLEDITPFLEPTAGGVSTKWAARAAQRYRCYVTVGYPERSTKKHPNDDFMNFNSQVTVLPSGEVLSNYRKRFLYYTDETWASEGDKGFYYGAVDGIGCIAMGICMDINPYQFLAPWTNYEFASHVLETGAQLVIVSMAFLTRLSPQELRELPLRPDNATLEYWVERFYPVHRSNRQPVFIVFSNRCGIEGSACYAGTSSIICFREGKGYIYDLLGKWDEQCLVVDLQKVRYDDRRMRHLTLGRIRQSSTFPRRRRPRAILGANETKTASPTSIYVTSLQRQFTPWSSEAMSIKSRHETMQLICRLLCRSLNALHPSPAAKSYNRRRLLGKLHHCPQHVLHPPKCRGSVRKRVDHMPRRVFRQCLRFALYL